MERPQRLADHKLNDVFHSSLQNSALISSMSSLPQAQSGSLSPLLVSLNSPLQHHQQQSRSPHSTFGVTHSHVLPGSPIQQFQSIPQHFHSSIMQPLQPFNPQMGKVAADHKSTHRYNPADYSMPPSSYHSL